MKRGAHCNIHNIDFSYDVIKTDDGLELFECPYCLAEENKILKEQRDRLSLQFEALVGAIKIIKEHAITEIKG
jgi:hypothetical protein